MSVCPSVLTSHFHFFQFLQQFHKMSLMKDAWHVLGVKNMQSGSPSDPLGPSGKVKLSSEHYNINQGEANLRILKLTSMFYHLPRVGSKQLCALAHLGYTREVGTSQQYIKEPLMKTFLSLFNFLKKFDLHNLILSYAFINFEKF